MTPEHAKAVLPFIQAFAEGKTIIYNGEEVDDPEFLGAPCDYSIAPDKILYRVYLAKSGKYVYTDVLMKHESYSDPETIEKWAHFVRWIDTDWKEA